jgi:hypothetical protein
MATPAADRRRPADAGGEPVAVCRRLSVAEPRAAPVAERQRHPHSDGRADPDAADPDHGYPAAGPAPREVHDRRLHRGRDDQRRGRLLVVPEGESHVPAPTEPVMGGCPVQRTTYMITISAAAPRSPGSLGTR